MEASPTAHPAHSPGHPTPSGATRSPGLVLAVLFLEALVASTSGKVELDTLDDDGGEVLDRLLRQAVLTVFRDRLDVTALRGVPGRAR